MHVSYHGSDSDSIQGVGIPNVNYEGQIVQVLALLTHAEYDKDFWKQRY